MVGTRSGASNKTPTKARPTAITAGSAAKKKNKVAPVLAVKSPDIASRPSREELDDSSDQSLASSTKSRPGLEAHVQKALAECIEEAGGIGDFKKGKGKKALSGLLDQGDPDVFGLKADPIRTQLRKYVNRWEKYHQEGTYEAKVLNRWKVLSSANRKKEKREASKASKAGKKKPQQEQRRSESDRDSSSSSSSTSTSISSKESVAKVSRKQEKAAPPRVIKTVTKTRSPSPRKMSSPARGSLPRNTTRISVNVDCPEANGDFFICGIGNLQGVKKEERHEGFKIQMLADRRWIEDDQDVEMYSGRVYSEDALLIKVPAMPYSILKYRDKLLNNSKIGSDLNDAYDDIRHAFTNDKANRFFAYYLLEFPPGVTLSSSQIFTEAGDDEELDYDFIEVKYTPDGDMSEVKELWVHFKVARTDVRATKRGKIDQQNKKSRGASKLSNLDEDDLESSNSGSDSSEQSRLTDSGLNKILDEAEGELANCVEERERVLEGGNKRDFDTHKKFRFSGSDSASVADVDYAVSMLGEQEQLHAAQLNLDARAVWLNGHLDAKLLKLPLLQQMMVAKLDTNADRLAKLLEYTNNMEEALGRNKRAKVCDQTSSGSV